MGCDHPSPWANLKRPLWQCLNPFDAAANNMRLQQHCPGGHLHTERWVFAAAAHMNPLKQRQQQQQAPGGGVLPSGLGISSLVVPQVNSGFSRPIITSIDVQANGGGGGGLQERKFLIFDQSGSCTTMIFSSVSPALPLNDGTTATDVKQSSPLQADDLAGKTDVVNRSDETTSVSQGSKRDGVNEETDDIDALLYSDSEEEEGNTGPSSSPDRIILAAATAAQVEEEVASSGGPLKRRKLDDEKMHDEALMDTASSTTKTDVTTAATTGCYPEHAPNRGADGNDRSSCAKDGSNSSSSLIPSKCTGADRERNQPAKGAGSGRAGSSSSMWKMKRDHIRETVNVLRGIIPGCKGKDACLVLDEAIRYLKSLELKVQTLGGTL